MSTNLSRDFEPIEMRIFDFGTRIVFEIRFTTASFAALFTGGAWTRIVRRRNSGSHETISLFEERGLTRTLIRKLSANVFNPCCNFARGDGAQGAALLSDQQPTELVDVLGGPRDYFVVLV